MFQSGGSQSTSAYVDDRAHIVHSDVLRTTATRSFVRVNWVNQIFPKTSSAHLEVYTANQLKFDVFMLKFDVFILLMGP